MNPFRETSARLGITLREPESVYFSSGCLGSTSLNCYKNDGAEAFYMRHVLKDPRWIKEETDAMRAGKLIHAMVETIGEIAPRVIIAGDEHTTPSGYLSEKKATLSWIACQDPQKIVCTKFELDEAKFIYSRILANPVAKQMITGCQSEVTMRVKDPSTGLFVQTRVDVLQPWCRADIKKLGKPMSSFRYAFRDYGMDLQASLYDLVDKAVTGIDRPHYWIIAQDVYPFSVEVRQATDQQLAEGAVKMNEALDGIAAGNWGTPQTEPKFLEV